MKWIEIIRLRSAKNASEPLKAFLPAMGKTGQPGLLEARIYRHALWETDWSLHLLWESENPEKSGSTLGLRLAQALKDFGLVDHSVWTQDDEID